MYIGSLVVGSLPLVERAYVNGVSNRYTTVTRILIFFTSPFFFLHRCVHEYFFFLIRCVSNDRFVKKKNYLKRVKF